MPWSLLRTLPNQWRCRSYDASSFKARLCMNGSQHALSLATSTRIFMSVFSS